MHTKTKNNPKRAARRPSELVNRNIGQTRKIEFERKCYLWAIRKGGEFESYRTLGEYLAEVDSRN